MRLHPHVLGVATLESLRCGQLLPKCRLCSCPAATLAGNMRSSRRRDGSEPAAVPGDVKSSQRDDAETPALAGSQKNSRQGDTELPALAKSGESHGEGSTEPLARGSGESRQRDDAEQPALAGLDESGRRGAVERPPAQEPEGSAVSVQGAAGGTGPPETSLPFPWAPVPACPGHKPPGMPDSPTQGDQGRWSWGFWGHGGCGWAVPVWPQQW